VITIEDGGLAMPPEALRRAERMVSSEPLDLTTLSGTRLGLAVVGCLAHKYGLKVFFRPSSRGGTGVVVTVPPPFRCRREIQRVLAGESGFAHRIDRTDNRVGGKGPTLRAPVPEVFSPGS
jgi:hypothetical protein